MFIPQEREDLIIDIDVREILEDIMMRELELSLAAEH